MERPFASRALVVRRGLLRRKAKSRTTIDLWRLSVNLGGAGRLRKGAGSLDTLSLFNILLSPNLLYVALCIISISFFKKDQPFNLLTRGYKRKVQLYERQFLHSQLITCKASSKFLKAFSVERAAGFEPATFCLGSRRSTTEPCPRSGSAL